MPEGLRPRGVTPRPRSGAAAESARLRRRKNGREELPKSETKFKCLLIEYLQLSLCPPGLPKLTGCDVIPDLP